MSFVSQNVLETLPALSPAQLDDFDFGVVKVDDTGTIEFYNRYEANLAGVEPSVAEGRNFFTQIAPCTNNRLLFGRFKEGVAADCLCEAIPYTFTYKMKPTNVNIHLYRDPESRTNWVLVKKR